MAENQPTKYRGNCHCTAYVFEVDLPENIENGLQCSCSYCCKRGAVFLAPKNNNDIKFVKGDPTALSNYNFGGVKHQFCSTCCTFLFRVDTKKYVNLRALQKIKAWDLGTQPLDDKATPPAWSPPKFDGQEPPAEIEGAKIYTGGCHCGAVTLALKSKPIDSTYEGLIMECDCSICTRNAYCWIYPNKPQVTIVGATGMGYYSFGGGVWRKSFCRTCGVPVHNRIEDYTPAQIEELPVEQQQWARDHLDWSPVNLRVMDGIDLGELKIKRIDGSTRSGPPKPGSYVDP
ncbi:Mss4-like protein [Daldinia loculata]|uniref:Mss4-like protein n=1 Tax=Daldinia loculata TaxID=103429 RepID=UPI0020C37E78|nr:Mss4-like protein [Daldinia loculata]KAI1651608.1 Mss4-like protein [Daldinia loculata]